MKAQQFVATFLLILSAAQSLRILGVFPHLGKSHFFAFEPLLKALAEKGHELTVVSNFPQKSPPPRYKDILLNAGEELDAELGMLSGYRYERHLTIFMLAWMGRASCENGLFGSDFQKLVKSDEKFDLMLVEMFNTDCYLGLAHKFKVRTRRHTGCSSPGKYLENYF